MTKKMALGVLALSATILCGCGAKEDAFYEGDLVMSVSKKGNAEKQVKRKARARARFTGGIFVVQEEGGESCTFSGEGSADSKSGKPWARSFGFTLSNIRCGGEVPGRGRVEIARRGARVGSVFVQRSSIWVDSANWVGDELVAVSFAGDRK